jgi:acyl-coenzyme A thioesterase PaaI-like protein
MKNALDIYNTMKGYPLGKQLFSWILCRRAPYFGTISPLVTVLEPGRCMVKMKKKKAVTNHIGTVHAIAMCNLVELAGGLGTDVSIPAKMRWIPESMTVEYLAPAKTDLTGIFEADVKKLEKWNLKKPFPAEVKCYDTNDKVVMKGIINMHLSLKKK